MRSVPFAGVVQYRSACTLGRHLIRDRACKRITMGTVALG
jgi:hypothetical protein